jgi:hypothetical protein
MGGEAGIAGAVRCGAAAGADANGTSSVSFGAGGGGGLRRGAPVPAGRRGEPRGGKSSRCALPTIAFFENPKRRPISAVEWPSRHSARSAKTRSGVQPQAVDARRMAISLCGRLRVAGTGVRQAVHPRRVSDAA